MNTRSAELPPLPSHHEPLLLTPEHAEAVVRVVETAPTIRRRSQFFYWTQGQLQTLLPHTVLVCGAYQRQHRDVVFEVFNSVVLPPPMLQLLTNGRSSLMQAVQAAWVEGRGRALLFELARFRSSAGHEAAQLSGDCAIEVMLVHGIARPQRPAEIESLFVLATPGGSGAARQVQHLEMMLPHLHATWQRVLGTERELAAPPAPPPLPPRGRAAPVPSQAPPITGREVHILQWVREGKSNHEIGEVLGISPLTVKNHVQKILRKLDASNRAQAVAKAMAMGLLGDGPVQDGAFAAWRRKADG